MSETKATQASITQASKPQSTTLEMPEIVRTGAYLSETSAARSAADEVLTHLRAFEIKDAGGAEFVGEIVKAAKARFEAIDGLRKKIVGPINAAKDAVQEAFAPPLQSWRAVESEGKAKIAAHIEAEREKKRALERAAEAAHAAGEATASVTALVVAAAAPAAPLAAGVSAREVWEGEVTDLMALIKAVAAGQAPASLIRADDSAIKIFARATKGTQAVPGVRFFTHTEVRASRRG